MACSATCIVVVGALLITSACYAVEEQDVLTVGVLLPWSATRPLGPSIASAATIAIDDINANASLLPDNTLRFVWLDTQCDEKMGLHAIVNMWSRRHADHIRGFIGPGCDVVCETAGLLASAWNMPIVSWGCTSNHLSDKDAYNTLARVVGPFTSVAPIGVAVMHRWRWKRVGILAAADVSWQLTAETLKVQLIAGGIDIPFFQRFEHGHKHMTKLQKARHLNIVRRAKDTVRGA
ncbi:PREDICTED: gamma-aminobutyric acid type B receptor subunit 1-like [Priapulus caudatus]|uniref:Gamma-aminobutyric acid type B receptor subunit 1-like n=1 Tax=Priapulus caudatus TaxID=37621 RepID=A0ABM1DW06_PRICU|nr:PREDICTED: gamma-aminobutyric acid type B receptor subunit 1-like [Priapulus caudatus]